MLNVMVANSPNGGVEFKWLESEIKAQIDNSLRVGWDPQDIILVANFDYEYKDVRTTIAELNKTCLTGSKLFATRYLQTMLTTLDTMWVHDLDCWQTEWFDEPEFDGDLGVATYSRPKINGGSQFWKPGGHDMVRHLTDTIVQDDLKKEEPLLNKVYKTIYKDRISILDNGFNVGCSGFKERCARATKPWVCHFHPTNRIAWDTFVRDRNRLGIYPIPRDLRQIFVEHFWEKIRYFTYTDRERGYPGAWSPPVPDPEEVEVLAIGVQ